MCGHGPRSSNIPQRQLWLHGMIMFADPMKMISTMEILSDEGLKYGTNYYNR